MSKDRPSVPPSAATPIPVDPTQPALNVVHDTGSLGVEKPVVHLDEEQVKQAEAEGKGYRSSTDET